MRIWVVAAALAVLALGCGGGEEARYSDADIDELRAEIAALNDRVERLSAAAALGGGADAFDADERYLTLDFFLADFSTKPVGARANIGEFLGVYRGIVAVCHGGPLGGPYWGKSSAVGGLFGGGRTYFEVQTTRRPRASGLVGEAQWVIYPPTEGEEGYCLRMR